MRNKKTRGRAVPIELKERAYQLACVGNYSYKEVAQIIGMPDHTVIYRWIQEMSRSKLIEKHQNPDIDNDVPVPPRKPQRYYLRLAMKLNVGESILFDTHTEGRRMYRAVRDMGFMARSQQDGSKMRVWKIADLDND